MKTQKEIEDMKKELEEKRLKELWNRDTAKTETDRCVAQNLVLIYVMQQNILLEVLK